MTEQPNSKDFPFNYEVQFIDGDTHALASYPEVESFIDSWCDDYYIEEEWDYSHSAVVPFDVGKIVWKSKAAAEQLEADRSRIQDEEFGDPLEEMDRRLKRDAIAVIIRKTDAYEEAIEDHAAASYAETAGVPDPETERESDSDEEQDYCPFCGADLGEGGECAIHGIPDVTG